MSRTLDTIRKAEKDNLLSPEEMRLFDTKGTQRVTREEPGTPPPNGLVSAKAVEEYLYLKQSIVGLLPDTKQRALLFASAAEGEGASGVAASFGIVLASTGERVLLVDGNFRNPLLHELFAVAKSHGTAELLSGQEKLKQVIKTTHVSNLSLVTAGSLPQNPSSLFVPEATDAAIRQMKKEADWVLLDAPAITTFNDAVALGPRTDGVILVVRAEKTRWEVARNGRERLEAGKATVLGVVLNDRKLHIPEWIYKRL